MKKVLIATTNKDKFEAVKKIFNATIFPGDEYTIDSLKSLDIKLEDKKEIGDNTERALTKALFAKESIKDYEFDYVVGLDDAIVIKGKKDPNIKEYLNKILYENYLSDGEEYSFQRAYAFVSKDNKTYVTTAEIPYIYHNDGNIVFEENSYQLAQVAYPIGYDKPINLLNEKEELEYYLKYVSDAIYSLNINKNM